MVFFSNAVNLTDGLDGLAISLFIVAAAAMTALAYVTGHATFAEYLLLTHVAPAAELTVFCGALVGAGLGFLWYNSHPAEVFMGRPSAPSRWAAPWGPWPSSSSRSCCCRIVGAVFVIEAFSVVIQVGSFKLTGQRVFRMAPLHHHCDCELIGWSEPKVISRFLIAAVGLRLFQPRHPEAAMSAFSVRGATVVVVGAARSGVAAAQLLAARGARVVLTERRPEVAGPVRRLEDAGIELELGGHRAATLARADLVVLSPRRAPRAGGVRRGPRRGVPVIGELELACRWLRGRVVAVTGPRASRRRWCWRGG